MCIPLYQYQSEELTIQTDIFRLGLMLELLFWSHFRSHIWTQHAQKPPACCLPLLSYPLSPQHQKSCKILGVVLFNSKTPALEFNRVVPSHRTRAVFLFCLLTNQGFYLVPYCSPPARPGKSTHSVVVLSRFFIWSVLLWFWFWHRFSWFLYFDLTPSISDNPLSLFRFSIS